MTGRPEPETLELRLLVANERPGRLEEIARILRDIGHDVVAQTLDVEGAGMMTRIESPDVAFVAVGGDPAHALEQIESIAEDATCPVVVVVEDNDPAFVAEAAKRGAFAVATDTSADDLQSSIEIALRRFAELRDVQETAQRRAIVERAKGILMERHQETEREAFERLRWHARKRQERVVSVATSLLAAHELLPGTLRARGKEDEDILPIASEKEPATPDETPAPA